MAGIIFLCSKIGGIWCYWPEFNTKFLLLFGIGIIIIILLLIIIIKKINPNKKNGRRNKF
ncbi:hypothetical protein J4221_02200 [Candidatus Pacearchaeota archaeon]|nr:hypothetical protein [Candidatus Pacearchaeota archaeon]